MILRKRKGLATPWLSISDLMTILMFLFLLCFVIITKQQQKLIKENDIAKVRGNITKVLIQGFSEEDLRKWGAKINDKNGDVNILNIDFDSGRSDLKPQHQGIFRDFFPKYIELLSRFSNEITDIKIEGHTDSDGLYLMNLRLSQDRSREVLAFLIREFPEWEKEDPWFFKKLSASGRSESQLAYTNADQEITYSNPEQGMQEDKTRSRRVVFRFILREADFSGNAKPIVFEQIVLTNMIEVTNTDGTNPIDVLDSENTEENRETVDNADDRVEEAIEENNVESIDNDLIDTNINVPQKINEQSKSRKKR